MPAPSQVAAPLQVGMKACTSRLITSNDLLAFATLTGDFNPLHVDKAAAAAGPFGEPIAHGMLTASLISKLLGTELPGGNTIYLSQNLRFLAPVKVGDLVTATVEVTAIEKRRVTLRTVCEVDGKPVLEGEAIVLVPPTRLMAA
jgi:3-hydroxybutyryl-CoA dehydratase